jgi:hypothetical protein
MGLLRKLKRNAARRTPSNAELLDRVANEGCDPRVLVAVGEEMKLSNAELVDHIRLFEGAGFMAAGTTALLEEYLRTYGTIGPGGPDDPMDSALGAADRV